MSRRRQALLVKTRHEPFVDSPVSEAMKAARKAPGNIGNSGDEKPRPGGRDWLLALCLLAAVLLAYQPAWNGKPVWDDKNHLIGPALQSWHGLEQIWFQPGATPQYYPVVCSVFWLEQNLWGSAPAGCHLVNILLHVTSALLLVKVLRRLEAPGAWLVAALWALHPVQAESVAWMSEMKNTLSGLCYVGSALAYLRFDQEKKGAFYLVSLGLFGAGMLAKSVIATLPAALLLVFWWKRKGLRWKGDVLPLGPFFVVGIGLGLFTAWMERTMVIGGLDQAGSHLSILERFLIPGRAVWFYVGKLAWPHPLVFIYPRWEVSGAVWWQWLYPAALLLLAAGLWIGRRRVGNGPLVALLFFAGTLFPALGFFDVYPFRYSFVADHFQYLACLGPLALAAAGIERGLGWAARRAPLWKPAGCAVLLALLGALTWVQCGQYSDPETLWRATLARNPGCWMAHNDLGTLLLRQGNADEAAGHFKAALAHNPDDAQARYNLGNVLLQTGDVAEAIAQFRKGLDILPNDSVAHDFLGLALLRHGEVKEAIAQFQAALNIDPDFSEAHSNLGFALFQQGNVAQAIAHYQKALDFRPDWTQTRQNLGLALLRNGDFAGAMACFEKTTALPTAPLERWNSLGRIFFKQGLMTESIACYRQALSINPSLADAWAELGMACLQNGQSKEAEESWQKSLDLIPAQPQIQNNLASVLATAADASLRDGAKAVALAGQANQATGGGNPMVLCTLAAAYAETGRFAEASATARKALDLAQAQKDDKLAGALQDQIELYDAGRPMRNAPR